jgi:hypothetical protein
VQIAAPRVHCRSSSQTLQSGLHALSITSAPFAQ